MISCLIPARLGSVRFPGKPLADLGGKPMIVRTLEQVNKANAFSRIVCLTDSIEIQGAVENAGFEALLTPSDFKTGGDRVAWGAEKLGLEKVINVQGDEPLVSPTLLQLMVERLRQINEEKWLSACCVLNAKDWEQPSVVKVFVDTDQKAVDFQRILSKVDFQGNWAKHIGVYGYGPGALESFAKKTPTLAEEKLSLEQLRIFPGTEIELIWSETPAPSVDIPEDLEKVKSLMVETGF